MARRKKKSTNRKSGPPPASAADRDFADEVREAISAGRGRKALGLLKEARKAKVEVDEKLSVSAYCLRLSEMVERGQMDEARQMFEQVLRPMPAWREQVSREDRFEWMLSLGLDEGWSEYGADPEVDAAMDRVVLTRLRNPRLLADHAVLADEHPLKAQARAVLEAWALIDQGQPTEAQALLGRIGRRSPLRGWRAVLQGLMAYYAGDDKQVESSCRRIPDGAAVQPMAEWLRALSLPEAALGDEASREVAERLRKKAEGNELKRSLANVDALVEQGAPDKALIAASDPLLRELLSTGRQQLAFEVGGFLFDAAGLESPALDRFGMVVSLRTSLAPGHSIVRHEILEAVCKIQDCEPKRYDLQPPEQAVAFTEIAEEWLDLEEGDQEHYEDCGRPQEWQPGKAELAFDVCPACVIRFGLDACRRAIQKYPMESTFRTALKLVECQPDLDDAEEFLDLWRTHFPDSAEPLEKGVELYSKIAKFDKAEAALAELEKHRGGACETAAAARFDLAVPQALSLCVRGRDVLDEVNEILGTASTEGGRWRRVLFDTIRWKACGKARRKRAQQLEAVAQHERPLLFWHFCRVMENTFPKSRLPEAVAAQLDSLDAVIGSLEDLTSIDHPHWKPDPHDIPRMLDKSPGLKKLGTAPAEVAARYLDLMPVLPLVGDLHGLTSMFELTTRFLEADDPSVAARFWGWRAVCYAETADIFFGGEHTPEVVSDCVLLALRHGLDHPPILNMLRKHNVDIEPLRREAAELSKKRRLKILQREQERVTTPDLMEAVLQRRPSSSRTTFPIPHPSLPDGIEDHMEQILLEIVGDGPINAGALQVLVDALGISLDIEVTEDRASQVELRIVDVLENGFGRMPDPLVQRIVVQLRLPGRDRSPAACALSEIIQYALDSTRPAGTPRPTPGRRQPELPLEFDDPQ